MVEGGSGLLAVHPPDYRPHYEPSKRRLTWPNGAVATLYNAREPDQLRGPQHDAAWCDEMAKWRYVRDTWDQLQFGLRLGDNPRQVITTTPRPIRLLKDILGMPSTVATRGSTLENRANLAPSFIEQIQKRYGGTRLGRQELDAEILDDIPGALWTRTILDECKMVIDRRLKNLQRIVVAVDPSGIESEEDEGDDIGIIVAAKGRDGRAYVLADRTCRLSPDGWARVACNAYAEFSADRIVAERNFGGAMVEAVIRTKNREAPVKLVTASRGKVQRAEPVAALYEQGRVSHVLEEHDMDHFNELEDELCQFTRDGFMGEDSPNRGDALVWALTELMIDQGKGKARMF